jgi:hypothetical protein
MSNAVPQLTQGEVMDVLETGWRDYFIQLAEMPEAERNQWAERMGFANPRDVLTHVNAWFEELLKLVPIVMRGERYQRDWADFADFNARAIANSSYYTLDDALIDGERLRKALRETLGALGDEIITNDYLYRWIYGIVVEHIHEHALTA